MRLGGFTYPVKRPIPFSAANIRPHWMMRGLKHLYVLCDRAAYKDVITGRRAEFYGNTSARGAYCYTSGISSGDYIALPYNISLNVPFSFVVVAKRVSGNVLWSSLSGPWDGAYAGTPCEFAVVRSSSFAGSITATVQDSLSGAMSANPAYMTLAVEGTLGFDTSYLIPNFAAPQMVLGRAFNDNPTVGYHYLYAIFGSALTPHELRQLANDPFNSLFSKYDASVFAALQAGAAPTLSDLRAVNVTSSSAQWSLDYTF